MLLFQFVYLVVAGNSVFRIIFDNRFNVWYHIKRMRDEEGPFGR